MQTLLSVIAVAAGAGLFACSASQYPNPDTAPAQSTISAAQQAGAATQPRAALHLKLARDQVTSAQRLIEDSDYDEAYLVLQRAEADAKLALALATDAQLQRQGDQALQRIEDLKRSAR